MDSVLVVPPVPLRQVHQGGPRAQRPLGPVTQRVHLELHLVVIHSDWQTPSPRLGQVHLGAQVGVNHEVHMGDFTQGGE